MRSIKPGRGPSAMGGVASLFSVIFGILWTALAFNMTSGTGSGIGTIFPLFGVFFVIFGIVKMIYNFSNATRPDRLSSFDIVDGNEEPDPLNQRFGRPSPLTAASNADEHPTGRHIEGSFCPYCRAPIQPDFAFCAKCGADL